MTLWPIKLTWSLNAAYKIPVTKLHCIGNPVIPFYPVVLFLRNKQDAFIK